jgi:4-amino-4-deoxy-L-arabinose transferase-like glycosyltransferase
MRTETVGVPAGADCPGPQRLRRFAALLGAYLVAHLVLRLLVSTSLQWDEAEQAVLSQSLAWGYSEQPPLYTWLTWGLFRLFGPGVLGLAVLKTLAFAGLFGSTYRTAVRLLRDARLARYAAFSLILIPYFAWEATRDGTHTVLLAAAVAATVGAALRVIADGRARDYAALGAWVAVGLLSKYSAALCHAAVLAASLAVPAARRRLLDRRVALTVAVAATVALPHLVWLAGHRAAVTAFLAGRAEAGEVVAAAGAGRGAASLFLNLVTLSAPLAVVLGACARTAAHRPPDRAGPAADACRWLRWYVLALVAGLLVVVAGGATTFMSHWLPPLFVPLPVYLFLRLRVHAVPRRRLRRYAAALVAACLAGLAGRASLVWWGGKGGGWQAGRDRLYALASRHWDPASLRGATFVVDDLNVGGNLRLCFPAARVCCTRFAAYDPPAGDPDRPRVVVWPAAYSTQPPPSALAPFMPPDQAAAAGVIAAPADQADRRYHTLRYVVVSGCQLRR